ncbi:MAG: hypothetical protein AABZ16_09175, partial [candidate division NC10 bacterium]
MTDRVSWATARANMYRFLSAAFLEVPSAAMVAPLLADGFVDGLEEMFGAGVADDPRQFVRGFQGEYAALDQEFQDLFMVPL